MNAPTDWTSAIAILAAGILIGGIIFFMMRRKTATIDTNLERKDLEAKRDALIAQLRALPDDAVDERARLERETADVLRALDASGGQAILPVQDRRDRLSSTTMSPTIKGFLWGAGSFAALAALGYFVMQSSSPREQQQTAPMAQTDPHPQTPTTDPQVIQLEAAVQKDPNNLALRNDLAQAYLERDNLMAVFEQTKFILAKNPNDSRALTFQALVRMAMGEADTAQKMLQQAIQADPKNLDARVSLAWVFTQNNDIPSADAAIADAVQASPNDKARLEEVLRQMKAQAAQQPAAQPAATAQPAGKSVRVTLSLATDAPAGGVLFVIARNPAGGPPAAVKRIDAASFPVTIDLSQADSMMGQPLPDRFRLEARLDSDGDPLTKPPTDPSAFLENVTPGVAVTLALK
ncbi:MAG TPA: tetratricopeptide repeat protein [Thermoanaerobaculia bacterium]|nr:tetratricopeptide repeat protein [Thermoanaerobaculia bacterium]